MKPPAGAVGSTVALLAVAAFFSGAGLRICDVLLPRLAGDFGISTGTAGRVVIGFSVAYGLMQLVFGPLGDRIGRRNLMLGALLGCAAAALASALAPSFELLVGTRIVWGMAAAGIIPTALAWIGDTVRYEDRQATLGRLLLGTLSGLMAGQVAGGLFADAAAGWRGAFGLLAAGYLAVGMLMLLGSGAQAASHAAQGRGASGVAAIRQVLAVPWCRVVLFAVLLEGVFLLGPLTYVPAYLHQRHGVTMSTAAALVALYAVGGLAYAVFTRQIVARLGERRMAASGGALIGASFAAWLLLSGPWLAGAAALLLGFGTYLFHNTLQTHATQMAPAVRGTGVALFAFGLFAGQALGTWLGGLTVDHAGFAPLLLAPVAVMPLAGTWFAVRLKRRPIPAAATAAA